MKLIINGLPDGPDGHVADDYEVEIDHSPPSAVHPLVRLTIALPRGATRREVCLREEEATAIGHALLIAARKIAE